MKAEGLNVAEYARAAALPERQVYVLANRSKAAKDGQWRKVEGQWRYFGPIPGQASEREREPEPEPARNPEPEPAARPSNPLEDRFEDKAHPESWSGIAGHLRNVPGRSDDNDRPGDTGGGSDDSASISDVLEVVEENFQGSTRRFHVPSRLKGWRVPYGQYIVFALAVGFFVVSYLRERAHRGEKQDRQNNVVGYRPDVLPGSVSTPGPEGNAAEPGRDSPISRTARGFSVVDY